MWSLSLGRLEACLSGVALSVLHGSVGYLSSPLFFLSLSLCFFLSPSFSRSSRMLCFASTTGHRTAPLSSPQSKLLPPFSLLRLSTQRCACDGVACEAAARGLEQTPVKREKVRTTASAVALLAL